MSLVTALVATVLVAAGASAASATTYSFSGHVYLGAYPSTVPAGAGEVRVEFTRYKAPLVHNPDDFVLTAADGSFSIPDLDWGGQYQLYYRYLGSGGYSDMGTHSLLAGSPSATQIYPGVYDTYLLASGELHGTVSLGTAGNPAGSGDVAVYYQRYVEGAWAAESAPVLTDASGAYSFGVQLAGIYSVRFDYIGSGTYLDTLWQGGYPYWVGGRAYSVFFGGATDTVGRDMTLLLPYTMTGAVRLADSPELAAYSLAGSGQVTVEYYKYTPQVGTWTLLGSTTTNASGTYSIPGLDQRVTYRLSFADGAGQYFAKTADPNGTLNEAQVLYSNSPTTLNRSYTVTGHVNLSTVRSAVAGEVVVKLHDTGSYPTIADVTTPTDSAGNYSFSGLPGKYFTVTLDYVGTDNFIDSTPALPIPKAGTNGVWMPTPADHTRNFVAPTGNIISGHVSLGSAGVSAGAGEVRVTYAPQLSLPQDFRADLAVLTDASGNYSILAVPSGTYTLHFEYLGTGEFSSEYLGGQVHPYFATTFPVQSNVSGKNVVLAPRAVVSGNVSFGAAGAHPVGVTAKITWDRWNGSTYIAGPAAGVTTDSSGAYSLPLDQGDYRFWYGPSSSDYQPRGPVNVSVRRTSLPSTNMLLPLAGSISGHVYLGDTSTSAGAGEVKITRNSTVIYTDASGNYQLPSSPGGLPNGTYTLNFEYVGTAYQRLTRVVTLADPLTAQTADVTLLPSASISGRVSLGSAATTAGVGEVTVSALRQTGPSSWTVAATATTDASGDYTIVGLEARSYRLKFHHNSPGTYPDLWWINAQHLTQATSIAATSTALTGYAVTMPVGVSFTGVLKNSSGDPLGGFLMRIYRYAADTTSVLDETSLNTAPDGSFAVTGLPAGRYMIKVYEKTSSQPYEQQWIGAIGSSVRLDLSKAIPLTSGQVHDFGDVVLMGVGKLSGTITCGGCGLGMYSQLYVLDPVDGWIIAGPNDGWSNSSLFWNLLPGTYQLRAGFVQDGSDMAYTSDSFTVAEGEQVTRNVVLVAGTLPVGRLVKSTASGATVVYLVDGKSRLVPVPVVSAATDAGVPAAVIAASPAALADYSISAPMSNMLGCYGYITYFAAGGKIWPIDPPLVSGVPKVDLLQSTCATLPVGNHWINGALFVKSSTSSAVYYITATGEKRRIEGRVSMGALSYPYWPEVLQVTSPYLSSLPTGPPIVPYLGKRPLPAATQAGSAQNVVTPVLEAPVATLTVDQRATCYSDYFQAIGVSMFAPLAQTVTLDAGCRLELALD